MIARYFVAANNGFFDDIAAAARQIDSLYHCRAYGAKAVPGGILVWVEDGDDGADVALAAMLENKGFDADRVYPFVALYDRDRIEVDARDSRAARDAAAQLLRAKYPWRRLKNWAVIVVRADLPIDPASL